MSESRSLVDNLRAIQIDCRYEREGALNTFHCYDVTGGYFDRCVEQAEHLEQRYQQLAEVARDMLKFLKNIEREYPRLLDPNRKPGGQILYPMPSDKYANQLEELGVEV